MENQHIVTVERTIRVSRKPELAREMCGLCVSKLPGVMESVRPKLHLKKEKRALFSWLLLSPKHLFDATWDLSTPLLVGEK